MENEQIDVQVEETTASPSEENQTEEIKEEKTVPYDRFKEVVDERNEARNLLKAQIDSLTSKEVKEPENNQSGESYEEALKIVQKTAEDVVSKKIDAMQRQYDLDKTAQANPDFFKYTNEIKAKIQENPHLSWGDAYKLAKFDAVQSEAKEQGKKEAYKNIEQKKASNVESASKSKSNSFNVGDIDPMAKDANGKYQISLSELKDLLK